MLSTLQMHCTVILRLQMHDCLHSLSESAACSLPLPVPALSVFLTVSRMITDSSKCPLIAIACRLQWMAVALRPFGCTSG